MNNMTLGKVAAQAGVGKETIRYYQRRGLIARPRKLVGGGYPQYGPQTIERLRFIKQAQEIGFSLHEIIELLALKSDPGTDCAQVRTRAIAKLDDVQLRLAHLERMRQALQLLIAACPGRGDVTRCSILEALQQLPPAAVARTGRSKTTRSEAMEQLVFDIEGMHCAGCAQTVKALLAHESGVQRAAVSFEQRQARVLLDAELTNAKALGAAVARAGYRLVPHRT